jgi:glycosyltransferase involved in cell wall biosynthesis
MPDLKKICLTPVMNEAWTLERFLKCTSTWADHIIVADQNSTDGSRDICARFPKVTLVENPSKTFNEPERQKLLLENARKIQGQRLLVALDADEFLTANFVRSPEWQSMLNAKPGTRFKFHWVTVVNETASYWVFPQRLTFAFMDDGSDHRGQAMHSPRLPQSMTGQSVNLNEIKILHYAYVDLRRAESKMHWYQCLENLNKLRRPIDTFRFNHKDITISAKMIRPLPEHWLNAYKESGIDMTSIRLSDFYQWDQKVIELFKEHGADRFSKLAIWDVDWNHLHALIYGKPPEVPIQDPRTMLEKAVHAWLKRTQPYYSQYGPQPKAFQIFYFRVVNKLLKYLGW